jgi:lipopolysaccharide transport system ATP-binding protein
MLGSRLLGRGSRMSYDLSDRGTSENEPNYAISVENVGKCYGIYESPSDRLKQFVLPRLQKVIGIAPQTYFNEFWALKDVSFRIAKGETVGIIGRNGSGKSTLLQIICGTLTPTCGRVKTRGRVAALLELGSGFNPEFTGRENVFMNASVLGLSNAEINDRFDRIAAFADIGTFIDQPVKIYSSGMFVRLAFAVIAHVDADILVIDEALAVGDAIFTQKCMRYIREFQERGTLLFVSHDMGSVQNLCKTGVWLGQGVVQQIGSSRDVSESYLQYTLQETYGNSAKLTAIDRSVEVEKQLPVEPAGNTASVIDYEAELTVSNNLGSAKGWKTGIAQILSVNVECANRQTEDVFLGGEQVKMIVHARTIEPLDQPILGFTVRDRLGQELFGENTLPYTDKHAISIPADTNFHAEFLFTLPMLPNGQYAVMASVAGGTLYNHVQHHFLHDALILTVTSSKIRWGLVGLNFQQVTLKMSNDK